jgi:PBP1b-binding outer membrane lipoprotein LpoB
MSKYPGWEGPINLIFLPESTMKSSIIAVVLAAAVLAGCGKKEEPKVEAPAAAPAPVAAPADAAKPAEEAKK